MNSGLNIKSSSKISNLSININRLSTWLKKKLKSNKSRSKSNSIGNLKNENKNDDDYLSDSNVFSINSTKQKVNVQNENNKDDALVTQNNTC